MENNPLISVVTVSYNAVLTIEQTILSVINQTYPYVEYIIIDGGSTDGTVDVIKKYADRIAYWVSEPDKGIYDAMNKGIKMATGKWINFMNSGDSFYNDDVIKGIQFEKIPSKVRVIYGDNMRLWKSGQKEYHYAYPIDMISRKIIGCHQSVFVSLLDKEDVYFDMKYKLCADYNQIYNFYRKYGKITFIYKSLPVSVYEFEEGVSSVLKSKCMKEKMSIHIQNKEYLSVFIDVLILILFKLRIR